MTMLPSIATRDATSFCAKRDMGICNGSPVYTDASRNGSILVSKSKVREGSLKYCITDTPSSSGRSTEALKSGSEIRTKLKSA